MDVVRKKTEKIYPNFWLAWDSDNFICIQSDSCEFAKMLNLYIYLIKKTKMIFKQNCDNYMEILESMSIMSNWSIEFQSLLNTDFDEEIASDIMGEIFAFSSLEICFGEAEYKQLFDGNDSDQLRIYDNHIKFIVEKINKIYLKLLSY